MSSPLVKPLFNSWIPDRFRRYRVGSGMTYLSIGKAIMFVCFHIDYAHNGRALKMMV